MCVCVQDLGSEIGGAIDGDTYVLYHPHFAYAPTPFAADRLKSKIRTEVRQRKRA